MDTPPPPPLPPGYTGTVFSPNTPTPRPEKRPNPSAFSSPVSGQPLFSKPDSTAQLPFSSPVSIQISPKTISQDGLSSTSIISNTPSPSNVVQASSSVPHFSTPLPPPSFSSPLRPAAVPFRASPMSPQPIAFSSEPTLPTSAPAHYANGSVDLQTQISFNLDDSVQAASPYVLFSSHKILKRKKLANISSLGFGALVSPGRETLAGVQVVQRDPRRCKNCGAYANLYCKILTASGQWQCVICKTLNGSEGEYISSTREDLRRWPELSSPLVDYVQTGNRRPGFIPVSDSRLSAPIFVLIDECLDETHLQHLQSSLHAFVDSLPSSTKIGIMSFGRTVSIYDFSEGSVASADVLSGLKSPDKEALKTLIYGTGIYLSPLHVSLSVAHSIISSLRPYSLNLPEVSRDRCLGSSVEIALAILQGPSTDMSRGVIKRSGGNGRILVCLGGPNTYGPGSVPYSFTHPNYPYLEKTAIKWMEHLGHEAHRHDMVVDILCAGTCPVRVPVLEPLARASGGVLVLHDDFGEAFGVNLQRAAMRTAGSHGLLEIRCSDDILVTQVIGPGEEAPSDAHETFKNNTSARIEMLSVEETQSFSVSMEIKGDIKDDYVFFQFVVYYSSFYQADISRVATIRLPTADSLSDYLQSVQNEVAAVIIGKRTLLQAKTPSDAVDMQVTIDERIKDIAFKFGSQLPKSKFQRFPKELPSLAEHLFHLRRGPLLGSILGHEDERIVLRNLFLHASFDLSLRMMSPRCLMHREGGTFEELPAYDLAMQSDSAVVLDHGTDVFIWLGAELASQEGKSASVLAACRTLAEELTEQRFPAPRILAFKEGSSQARYFVSRLIPSHKDPPYEQEARFPQLRSLTPEKKVKLKNSFVHFDDPSLCEWMRSLKLVPPEPI